MSFLVIVLANKSNPFGISKDVEVLRQVFVKTGVQFRVMDPLEPPMYSDLLIHLEVPIYGWMPWANKNILVVNPECFTPSVWNSYMKRFDTIVVKDSVGGDVIQRLTGIPGEKFCRIPWACAPCSSSNSSGPTLNEFVWVLGGSLSKRNYVPTLLKAWRSTYPKLTITTTAPLTDVTLPENVTVIVKDFTDEERREFRNYKGHVCCSVAEGFGYTAAEAEDFGAFTILNSIPVYLQDYEDSPGVAFLPSKLEGDLFDQGTDTSIQDALDTAILKFQDHEPSCRAGASKKRWDKFVENWLALFKRYAGVKRPETLKYLPPQLLEFPRISIVTLVYNRKKFFDLACHSIMINDYPKDRIEWIIVDDSDDPMEQNSDKIVKVANAADPLVMVYVPLAKKTSVAQKRNIGVERATSDIILMMDDDDHYPETSFRRRVAWLTKHPWKPKAVAATTIACYDLLKGVSAVNSPPLNIPLSQRISEATLTFYKSWWEEQKFPADVQVGEAEGFVSGRESDVLEIPPQQIIVAFSHGRNVSSRRIPSGDDLKPGCFWGFPKEFLVFVHGLAGVNVTSTV